ncbi:MAG: polysaccharide biosynthesis/export family protein [Desulfobacterales bacterium]|nr:polysaccharide biosynthesis/export family protein [Desulfobacterales bacterium]
MIFIIVTLFHSVGLAEEINPSTNKEEALVADPLGYKIGIADVLEVFIWKEPELSREVKVRLDGRITFPLLDDVDAAGLTTFQLKQIIQKKLGEFVESPFVTITLKASGSQKFYILGEVAQTGEYPLEKDLTVLQAFALAGGFTEWASKKEILLLRKENDSYKAIRVNYKDIANNKDISTNIPIQANDTIIVP